MTILQSRTAFKHFAATLLRRPGEVTAEARLPEGLSLTFARVPDGCRHRWKLVLTRESFFPTESEVEDCCVAFHVPPSVTERRMERFLAHPKSGRRIHYHVVELTWHDDIEATSRHGDTQE